MPRAEFWRSPNLRPNSKDSITSSYSIFLTVSSNQRQKNPILQKFRALHAKKPAVAMGISEDLIRFRGDLIAPIHIFLEPLLHRNS